MPVQLQFEQGALVGEWGQALQVVPGVQVTVRGRATGMTTFSAWLILVHYAHNDGVIRPTPSAPVVLASGTGGTPTGTFTPSMPGAWLFELRTWTGAATSGAGDAADVRELRVPYPNLGICCPAPVVEPDLATLIASQVAAGLGRHDNHGGFEFGYGGPPSGIGLARIYEQMDAALVSLSALTTAVGAAASAASTAQAAASTAQAAADAAQADADTAQSTAATAQSTANVAVTAAVTAQSTADGAVTAAATAQSTANGAVTAAATAQSAADAAQAAVDAVEEIVVPTVLAWTGSALTLTRSGTMVYDGADTDVELSGLGPHTPGATLTVKFSAGTITGGNAVTMADSLGPLDTQDDGEEFDPALDYYVMVTAISATELLSTARVNVVRDTVPPQITAASVTSADPDAVIVTTNEIVTWAAATGFSIAGHTITGVSGSGTSWTLQLGEDVTLGEDLTLVWDGTNVVQDGSGNLLVASSRSVTNSIGRPTFVSLTVNEDVLTLEMSEACDCTAATGLDLTAATSGAEIASYTSGDGTTTLVFALDGPVVAGETVTLDVAGTNAIASSSTALSPAAAVGVEVTNNTAGGVLWQDTFDRADGALGNNWTTTHAATIVSNALEYTDLGATFGRTLNPAGGALPADIRVTATIPHTTAIAVSAYWGLAARSGGTAGIRLLFTAAATPTIGNLSDWNAQPQSITVTGGFPATWSVDQDHTVALEVDGNTARIILDGSEYGTADISAVTGTQAVGGSIGICGEARNRRWLDVTVTPAGVAP